jgi:uncharacterized protein YfaP (DUF2135 family)
MILALRLIAGALAALLLGTAALVFAAEPIVLESPVGGWRDTGRDSEPMSAAVYPAPLASHARHRASALIRGRIAGAGNKSWTLVVNGNPVWLAPDADGAFARPWAFGPGSNGVEIRGEGGRVSKRVQLHSASGAPPARLRIILGWDTRGTDVDLHVVTPDGQHAFYGNPMLASGGGIDVDDFDGGPEIFSTAAPLRGTYLVYVNYFGAAWRAGTRPLLVTATVTVVTEENTVHEKRETRVVPLRNPGDLTLAHVVRF